MIIIIITRYPLRLLLLSPSCCCVVGGVLLTATRRLTGNNYQRLSWVEEVEEERQALLFVYLIFLSFRLFVFLSLRGV